jgi:hypothetical protein
MRREAFQAELTVARDGFSGASPGARLRETWHSGQVGEATTERPADLAVTAPLHQRRNLAAEEFAFLRRCTIRQAKVMASPQGMNTSAQPGVCYCIAGHERRC